MGVAAVDAVGVAVEVDEASAVDAQLPLHIAIEAGSQRAQGDPLLHEALPHRLRRIVRMWARLRRLLQLLDKSAVEFGQAVNLAPGGEAAPTHILDLLLDLALLPTRSRRAGYRLDHIVAHQSEEAGIEMPLLAVEHLVDTGLEVVINTLTRYATPVVKRCIVGGKHHLLGLTRKHHDKGLAAVGETKESRLDPLHHAANLHLFLRVTR